MNGVTLVSFDVLRSISETGVGSTEVIQKLGLESVAYAKHSRIRFAHS